MRTRRKLALSLLAALFLAALGCATSRGTLAGVHPFWTWFSPGFWAAHLEFDSRIVVTGAMEPFREGREFKGYIRLATQAATGRAWLNTINKGLEKLTEDIQDELSTH